MHKCYGPAPTPAAAQERYLAVMKTHRVLLRGGQEYDVQAESYDVIEKLGAGEWFCLRVGPHVVATFRVAEIIAVLIVVVAR